MKKAFLVYPHQLFEDIHILTKKDIVFLIEDPLFFSEFKFHKQKIILHRSSMKAYEEYLKKSGISVHYIEFHQMKTSADIIKFLKIERVESVDVYNPTDDWLITRIKKSIVKEHIDFTVHESPMFLTTTEEFSSFFEKRTGSRKYFMNDFYIWQRKRLNILVENDKPVGGKWSFDEENRKKLPSDISIPESFKFNSSTFVLEAIDYVEKYFPDNFGDTEKFWCPITHAEAKKHLHDFFRKSFELFGPYEDAITRESPTVFHSTISPLLNNGLLTPAYVIEEMHKFLVQKNVSMSSIEGFVRQIIGWREYIRALYVLKGGTIRTKNYFNAKNSLPKSFWEGTTGLDPIDHHIDVLKQYAYTHHIPRLMIFGNCMNLCHIKPDEVYAWFMEMYIDAYDWVMVPNVYSMTLYADGGLLTTKPYISSSNYILKMSDFKKSEWCEFFDGLFWSFVGTHFEKLQKEGRLGFIAVQYQKMTEVKKELHQKNAKIFLEKFLK